MKNKINSAQNSAKSFINLLNLILLLVCNTPAVHAQFVYNFDNLTLHSQINGQDNWVDQSGQGTAAVYQDMSPENGTLVVMPVATVIFNQSAFITRRNDAAFNFVLFSGSETNAIMQFDVTGSAVGLFALGFDQDNDGKLSIDSGEVGPAFGTWNKNFALQQVKDTALLVPFGSGNSQTDWYRMQLRMDFTTDGGAGSGSLFYLNVTDADQTYTPVSGLQNINLKLNEMHTRARPDKWNTMWIHLLADGGKEPAVDNLVPATVITDINELIASIDPGFLSISPNPFNESVTFMYSLPLADYISIELYDCSGVQADNFVNEFQEAGPHEITLQTSEWPSGIYFCKLVSAKGTLTKKIMKY